MPKCVAYRIKKFLQLYPTVARQGLTKKVLHTFFPRWQKVIFSLKLELYCKLACNPTKHTPQDPEPFTLEQASCTFVFDGGAHDFWDEEKAQQQIAKFNGTDASVVAPPSQSMPMLVAVRVRPLGTRRWRLVTTPRTCPGEVVVVLDPWYDADLNPNRSKEKKYADVVFDEGVGQEAVYQQTARPFVGCVRWP